MNDKTYQRIIGPDKPNRCENCGTTKDLHFQANDLDCIYLCTKCIKALNENPIPEAADE